MTDGLQDREPAWHEARLAVENKELRVEVDRLRQQHDAAVRSTARQLEHENAAPFDDCDCKLCQALIEVRYVLAREDRLKQLIAELEAEVQRLSHRILVINGWEKDDY